MTIQALDHYTINCSDLEQSIRFYEEVVGLMNGDRPPFSVPGAWLYCGERPIVHLVGGRSPGKDEGTGRLDHVAFRAHNLVDYKRRLAAKGISFREQDVPDSPLHQVFLRDPDGVTIELNFWDEG